MFFRVFSNIDSQESFITQKVITVHQGLLLYMLSLLNEVTPSACRLQNDKTPKI